MDSDPELPWKVIQRLFEDDPQMLVRHHIDSYNDFFGKGIFKIFRERNPIILQKEQDPDTQDIETLLDMSLCTLFHQVLIIFKIRYVYEVVDR